MAGPAVVDAQVVMPRLVALGERVGSGVEDGAALAAEALSIAEELAVLAVSAPPQDPVVLEAQIDRIADIENDLAGATMAVVWNEAVLVRGPNVRIYAVGDGGFDSISVTSGTVTVSAATVDEQGHSPAIQMEDELGSLEGLTRIGVRAMGANVGGQLLGSAPTRVMVVDGGRLIEDATIAGNAVLIDHADEDAWRADLEADIDAAFEAGEAVLESSHDDAQRGADELMAAADTRAGGEVGFDGGGGVAVSGGAVSAPPDAGGSHGVGKVAGASSAATVVGGLAARAIGQAVSARRPGESSAADTSAPSRPVDEAICASCGQPLPADAKFCAHCGAAVASAPTAERVEQPPTKDAPSGFDATHRVGDRPLQVGGVPTGSYDPGTRLDAGLEVQLIEKTSDGWALIECENGWRCYVDANGLVPIGPPVRSATFRFYVEAPVWMQSSSGDRVRELVPGMWYEGLEERQGWVRALAAEGIEGWVRVSAIRRG
jgi:hypothetical protein